jgi:hypothetical protein
MSPELAKLLQSLVGVFFVFGLVYWLFPKDKSLSRKLAETDFQRLYPETIIQDIIISDDFRTAIVLPRDGNNCFGVIKILGDRTVTKLLSVHEIAKMQIDPNLFHLSVNDFTFPSFTMNLSPDGYNVLNTYIKACKEFAPKVKIHAL